MRENGTACLSGVFVLGMGAPEGLLKQASKHVKGKAKTSQPVHRLHPSFLKANAIDTPQILFGKVISLNDVLIVEGPFSLACVLSILPLRHSGQFL